ncbi:type I-C CRISPR-associated protein Cas5 [Limisphaera ngatamarikiensis]|uniref:Type I-C CRISPR-associated protein Cas5 n=1 Tax=Limisphaera ngatamarikiensis TaxID=1324935 RepID=A0A6M1RK51_9BACT|nr:type I-C CRISPR-associated protein Cas5c [Limisphaera ngatamarikiensis]NGO37969.1 type I-C CRISPR-associated protein Cas5 [Limisphaera ngatamarikiensis]
MKTNHHITIRVWGDFACFTRPEMKVERVSYPVMTPSAARGILEAIFWEPQMYYLVDAIRVVKKGRWFSFRRNEVIKVISLDSAKTWMQSPEKVVPIQAGGGADDGTQRNMLALQDVEYLITAEVRTTPLANRPEDSLAKYLAEIERRARQGKCFHRPGLGMREFAADFDWVEGDPDEALARRAAALGRSPDQYNEDIGLMLYDVFDYRERASGFRWLRPDEIAAFEISKSESSTPRRARGSPRANRSVAEPPRWTGKLIQPRAAFFHARVEKSKLDCHPDRVKILFPNIEGN